MNKKLYYTAVILFFTAVIHAQTIVSVDTVKGIWSAGSSPYIITQTVTVPADTSLVIQPGTEIYLAGNFRFKVEGRLIARGKEKEKIVFAFADSSIINKVKSLCDSNAPKIAGWGGIRFSDHRTGKDTSILEFCSINGVKALTGNSSECSGGAISIIGKGMIIIKKCMIFNNQAHTGAAIYCENNNPIIEGNVIERNKSISNGGAFFIYNSRPVIRNNLVRLNISDEFGGGFYFQNSGSYFTNNTVAENSARFGGAASMVNSNIRMVNNTVANNYASENGGGLHCIESSPYIKNTILWGNSTKVKGKQLYLYELGYPEITYSSIQDGLNGIEEFSDSLNQVEYVKNLDENPEFIINDTAYLALGENSYCIDAGSNKDPLISEMSDMTGRPRIINDVIDMGAQEFQKGIKPGKPKTEEDVKKQNDDPVLNVFIYPNPNQGKFEIKLTGDCSAVSLVGILNANGQLIHSENLRIDGNGRTQLIEMDISRGFYFLELKNQKGEVIEREKLIIE
ncbi:MAG TPA: right-handed parallel beta-helix repeat-containing protein [Bacteroidales bacterium]|nr:right-handed parallel beta-helix repeat-containing protein [Bacteroidales bacterium]